MTAGLFFSLALGAALACCALTVLAGLAAMRADRSWGDVGNWDGPLIFASLTLALAAALGLLSPLQGALAAMAPLTVLTATLVPYWGHAVNVQGSRKGAALAVLAGLFRRSRDLMRAAPRLLRDLLPAGATGGDPEATAPAPVIVRPRRTPSTARPDLAVGPALVPAQVAAELDASGVAVPACWAAVAEWIASFEPEDEDDYRAHLAENAAGILTVAETYGGQAEDFAAGIKFDPAVTAAHTDFADDFADTASAAVRVVQVYDSTAEGIQEHVDSGGTIVENARQWHGAGGPEGQAA